MSTSSRTWRERRNGLASLLGVPECGEHEAPTHVDRLALAIEQGSKLSKHTRSGEWSTRLVQSLISTTKDFPSYGISSLL